MPNQYLIDYLRENKNKFPFEVLKEKLHKAGYPGSQIEEAKGIVYGEKEEISIPAKPTVQAKKATSFWDFWQKKIYTSKREKILDFIAGFVFVIILNYGLTFLLYRIFQVYRIFLYRFPYYILILNFLIYLALIIYFFKKRKYIAIGMICKIVLSLFPHFILSPLSIILDIF